jgi:long-chain acyl-CoA synthetase
MVGGRLFITPDLAIAVNFSSVIRRYHEGRGSATRIVDFLENAARIDAEFIIHDDGYRARTYSYRDVARMAASLRARFRAHGINTGDAAVIWSESRPGWVAALWACLLDGVVVVPVDAKSSQALFERILQTSRAKIFLTGETVSMMVGAWRLAEIEQSADSPSIAPVDLQPDTIAEIVFTSGTTAEPKGVVITHRNLLANLEPVAREVAKYRKYAKPFLPLRILNLLPLSHLFGQSLALLIPPLIPVSVVFMTGTSAQEIVRQIHSNRISALVAVPKVLEVLRDLVTHRFPETAATPETGGHFLKKWWRYRRVHRMFGWKYWCFISGGAPLPPELEKFWSRLGYLVVQGYGLTETAPIVTLSHPFHVRAGTVGKPLSGVKLKIAEDGEVLVRGDNVTTGYFESPGQTRDAFDDGWFRTGDIGELDRDGYLVVRGRKKEMIVTPEGLKVFPDDVEKVLNQLPGVRESAVIGKDRVNAVLLLNAGANADAIVREANQRLEDHQKIRSISVWTGGALPRTQATGKLRRVEIAEAIAKGETESAANPENELIALMRKYAPGRTITAETTLDELGLSSLDRVQLMMDLEHKLGTEIDEGVFSSAHTVADLERPTPVATEPIVFPAYNRTWFARAVRRVALPFFLLPLSRVFAHLRVTGRDNLESLHGPVIFAANHQSLLDVPVILASVPSPQRYRVATAMGKGFFDAHFYPQRHTLLERFTNTLSYRLATFFFNTFPLPQHGAGTGQAIRYMGELVEQGWSIVIFPEGDRSRTGQLLPFQPGVGMIASHLKIPVVPVRILGLEKVLHRDWKFPRPGRVRVNIGTPLLLSGESFAEGAKKVEEAVSALK